MGQIQQTENNNEANGIYHDKFYLLTSKSKSIKINKQKKEPSQESFNNISSSEQRLEKMNYPLKNKNSGNGSSERDSNQTNYTNYICLNGGQVIIKGNEIETNVSCDIERVNKKVIVISPNQQVKIQIIPLASNLNASGSVP
jgi:hypothetical protein